MQCWQMLGHAAHWFSSHAIYMAEADDIQKLLRLVENTLNFDLRFVVILVVGKSNHII